MNGNDDILYSPRKDQTKLDNYELIICIIKNFKIKVRKREGGATEGGRERDRGVEYMINWVDREVD